MPLGPGSVLAQKYRLEARVASGGMGSVWSAFDLRLDRKVAVKLIVDSMSDLPDVRARFLREAQAAGKLTSPYVVQVLDYGVDESTPFMVLEWLDGEDLHQRLKKRGRLNVEEVLNLLRQLGKGLRRAHDADLVHRDIKPPNLFIARHDDEEILKILDFGIAKGASVATSGDNTRTGIVVGSLRYMSPEQARGLRSVDHRADVWSVGVVLFQCLSGKLPYEGESDADLLVKLCTEPPRTISSVDPALDRFDPFFARCFARDVDSRFASVDELVSEFHRAAGREDPGTQRRISLPGAPPAGEPTAAIDASAAPSSPSVKNEALTADPVQPTLRGSSISLRPRRPLRLWGIAGSVVGVGIAVGAIALLRGGAGDEPRTASSPEAQRPSPAPIVAPAPADTTVANGSEPAATSTTSASAAVPATSASSKPAPRSGPAVKRPAIPQNPY